MAARATFPLISLLAFAPVFLAAQEPSAPPEVDKDLRARVTEFFQYHVDGNFRKAYEMVAEDTKDEYFAAGKIRPVKFQIDSIKYSGDFKQADVLLSVTRTWRIQGTENSAAAPMPTTWKIENGKWVWYHKVTSSDWLTPMGPSDRALIQRNADGTVTLPKDLTPELIAGAASKILEQTGVDKTEVKLSGDKASSDKVVFRNGAQGPVSLELQGVPSIPGFKAELDKSSVNLGESAVLRVSYDPKENQAVAPAELRLVVAPFNRTFVIRVSFSLPDAPKPE